MRFKHKALVIAAVVIVALACAFSPYIDAYRASRNLDISGVKMLMTYSEVEKVLGKGTNGGGFGASYCNYLDDSVTIAYPYDGLFKGKVSYIETSNPEHSIFNVHPRDSQKEAIEILTKQGFRVSKWYERCFVRGNINVYFYPDSIRIVIKDWTLTGRVY